MTDYCDDLVAHAIRPDETHRPFDRVIVPILNRLARCTLSEVDDVVDIALAELGVLTGVDRVYVFVRRDDCFVDNTNEWTAPDIDPMIAYLQGIPISVIDPWLEPFKQEYPILVPDASAIPKDEPAYKLLNSQGIKSLLIAPMIDKGDWIGFLGFDWVRICLDERKLDAFLLQSVANGIGALLLRRQSENAQRQSELRLAAALNTLKETKQRLEETIQSAQAGIWQRNLATDLDTVDERVAIIIGEAFEDVAQCNHEFWVARMHPDDIAVVNNPVSAMKELKDGMFSVEFRLRHHAGHWVWVLASGRIIRSPGTGRAIRLAGILLDITKQKSREEALRSLNENLHDALMERDSAKQRFFDIAEISADWFWEQDADLRFTFISESFNRSVGGKPHQLGKTLPEIIADDPNTFYSADWDQLFTTMEARKSFRDFVFHFSTIGEHSAWIRFSGSPCFDIEGCFVGYRGVGSDITALYEAKQSAERLANCDPLTGLANRTTFQNELGFWVGKSSRIDQVGTVMMLDLDNFKTINDSFGHDVGDALLCQVAERLALTIRTSDKIARQGGDEFTLFLPDTDEKDAIDVAKRLVEELSQPFNLEGQSLYITVSIGITNYPRDAQNAADLLQNADIAMYRAKASGRSQYYVFHPEMRAEQARRTDMIQAIHRGLREKRFRLVLQPKFNLAADPKLVGAEALLRWYDPDFFEVSPSQFIPLAESAGLIFEIDMMVVSLAIQLLSQSQLFSFSVPLAINISAQSFQQKTIVDDILAQIYTAGVNPRSLQIEITETALMHRTDVTFQNIRRLDAAGIGVFIDDFGTGYSSLSYLQGLPLTGLKIDQSFVVKIGCNDTATDAIVRAVLSIADALGLDTVAEGVETREQLDWLRTHGCKCVQGYLLSAPIEIDNFIDFFAE